MVAQELSLLHPTRVGRLVLAATAAGGVGGASYSLHELADFEPLERARRKNEVADLTFTAEWQCKHPEQAQRKIRDTLQDEIRFADEPGARTGGYRQLQARSAHNTYDRLHSITSPILVTGGSNDGQALLAAQKAIADQIHGCMFQSVVESHKMLPESDDVYCRIVDFMRGQS